ncbi:transcription antitermination factor NusB [Spiribacter roseus]|nr:transcription antitermination factor NusB [Spiribacter roseus]KAF0281942.1 transcription antitermination factor NusB [Spiribacter roseus]KAF0283726.1 transcription antitermination factor NusB [Spiribacter roseus]KAF0286284.1 transcription antitermination factor NusB [Spiribacter sp. SSL99]
MTGGDVGDIQRQFFSDHRLGHMDLDYFSEVFRGVTERVESLDAAYDRYLDRPAVNLDPVERALLRLGSYELEERLEVPYRVCIDQAVELAKAFGAEQSHKYINGVLDRVARDQPLRAEERKRRRR